MTARWQSALLLVLFATFGCETTSSPTRYPQQPPPQQGPGPYAGGYGAPPNGPGAPPANAPPGTPPGAPPPPAAPAPPVAYDPINTVDIAFLRGRAQAVIGELINALDTAYRDRVRSIPFAFDDEVGEVNAYAACTREGKALMAITDGLLDIQAHLAQAKANDEIFGTRKVDEYCRFIARNQRPKAPVVRPPPGFFDPAQQSDARRVARQHDVLDEQLAFVLGHELAHHYLGHLPCTATGGIGAADLARALSSAVPVFNQPNELAADINGTSNLLTAGARHNGYHWTEGGALLSMQFFSIIDELTPTDIIFGFERTHPPPAVRVPVIQQTAATWRSSGGRLPWPF